VRGLSLILMGGVFFGVLPAGADASAPGLTQAMPSDTWKIDFKLSLKEREGNWVFAVSGTTNLPAETVLRVQVCVVEVLNDPIQGPREDDDEALVRDDDGAQAGLRRMSPGTGGFQQEVYVFSRKPYSIRYRAKIQYRPVDQTAAIGLRVGNDEFERKADLRVGTDDDYGKELKELEREFVRDLVALEKIGGLLLPAAAAPDQATWEKTREAARLQVGVLSERNLQRFNVWAIWLEGRARMYVGALCELATRVMAAVDGRWAGDAGSAQRAQELFKGFFDSVDQAYDRTGIDGPLDARRVLPILAAYEKALAPLRSWISEAPGDAAALSKKTRREGLVSLFDLPPLLENRRRSYVYLNAVSARLIRLLDLVDAGAAPEDLKQALREHDLALAEFRRIAGLP
jgi:hypothetical protein